MLQLSQNAVRFHRVGGKASQVTSAHQTGVRTFLADHPEVDDPRRHLEVARDAVAPLVARLRGVIAP